MTTQNLIQAACLLYVRDDDTFAVATRRGKTTLGLPGGKVDPGETFAEAAARESAEEAGIVVAVTDLTELYSGVCEAENAQSKPAFCKTYVCRAPRAAVLRQQEPGIIPDWANFEALLLRGTFKDYNRRVREAYFQWRLKHL